MSAEQPGGDSTRGATPIELLLKNPLMMARIMFNWERVFRGEFEKAKAGDEHAAIISFHKGRMLYASSTGRLLLSQHEEIKTLQAQVALLDRMAAALESIAKQVPEKPDYWSSCGQCEHNIEDAKTLLSEHALLRDGKRP